MVISLLNTTKTTSSEMNVLLYANQYKYIIILDCSPIRLFLLVLLNTFSPF